jgi:hypothetical protein
MKRKPTKKQVLRAIDDSIEHWQRAVTAIEEGVKKCFDPVLDGFCNSETCALCELFRYRYGEDAHVCAGCPLLLMQGETCSTKTLWGKVYYKGGGYNKSHMVNHLRKARKMVEEEW